MAVGTTWPDEQWLIPVHSTHLGAHGIALPLTIVVHAPRGLSLCCWEELVPYARDLWLWGLSYPSQLEWPKQPYDRWPHCGPWNSWQRRAVGLPGDLLPVYLGCP